MDLLQTHKLVGLDEILKANDRIFVDTSAMRYSGNGDLRQYLNDYFEQGDRGKPFEIQFILDNLNSINRIGPFLESDKVEICSDVMKEINGFVGFTCWAYRSYKRMQGRFQLHVHDLLKALYNKAKGLQAFDDKSKPSDSPELVELYKMIALVDSTLEVRCSKDEQKTSTDDMVFARAVYNMIDRNERTGIITADGDFIYLLKTVPGVLKRRELAPYNDGFVQAYSGNLLRLYLRREAEYGEKLREVEVDDNGEERLMRLNSVKRNNLLAHLREGWKRISEHSCLAESA